MGLKRRRPTPAQQRRIAERLIAKAPKRVRFGKRTVSLTLGRKRISYPFRYRKSVPAIGNWVHGKNPTILIDSDVKRKNRKALLVHEAVEQHLAENRGLSYRHAHRVAERMEKSYVTARGKSWKSYQNSVLRTKR
jgi:hypothetical protein